MSDTIKIWDDDGPDGKTACLEIDQGGNLDLYLRIVGTDWSGKRLVSDGFRASTSGAKCGLVTSCVALLGAIGRGDRAHALRIVDGMAMDLARGWSRLPNESHEARLALLRREPGPTTAEKRLAEAIETFERSAELADEMSDDPPDDDTMTAGEWGARAEAFREAAAMLRGDRDGNHTIDRKGYPCVHCGSGTEKPLFGACDAPDCIANRGPLISEHPDGRYATYDEVKPLALAMTDDDARGLIATMREQVGEESGS